MRCGAGRARGEILSAGFCPTAAQHGGTVPRRVSVTMREMAWRAFGQSFVTLLVILDPLGNIPLFLALTRNEEPRARHRAAYVAILVAGGVLLFLVALDMMRGTQTMVVTPEETSVALVPLGTPFLAGPGAIVATIVLTRQHPALAERMAVIGGTAVALVVVLAALRFASFLARLLRPSAIHFLTRIMGLLLTAIAIQLAANAIFRWIRQGLG